MSFLARILGESQERAMKGCITADLGVREISFPARRSQIAFTIPKSDSNMKRTANRKNQQAKLANVDAERAFSRAYHMELSRTKAIGEAMFKSGKALRFSLSSSGRQLLLRTEKARRQFEPGYRNKINSCLCIFT